MAKSSEDYTISDEEIEYWDSWHKARDERMAEFEKRENSVKSPFESFYYETETQLGQSYGELDLDILIKRVQNDIRLFLKKVGPNFNGEINLVYKKGKPEFIKATFEAISKDMNGNDIHKELLAFIGDFGLISHKKYGKEKRLYGEKYYRYTDKDWEVYEKIDGEYQAIGTKKKLKSGKGK